MISNFSEESAIGIVYNEQYYDLHNDFVFLSMDWRVIDRHVIMIWQEKCNNNNEALNENGFLTFDFSGVYGLSIRKQHDDMPASENRNLIHFSFADDSFSSDFDTIIPTYRGDDEHVTFLFNSGAGIKIWSESARAEYATSLEIPS